MYIYVDSTYVNMCIVHARANVKTSSGRYWIKFAYTYYFVAIKSVLPDVVIPDIPITEYVFKDFKRFGDRPAFVSHIIHQNKL